MNSRWSQHVFNLGSIGCQLNLRYAQNGHNVDSMCIQYGFDMDSRWSWVVKSGLGID